MTAPYTLYSNVENPHDADCGWQDHWTTFRADNDGEAARIASERLKQWQREFGGWANAQLRNDIGDYAVAFQVTLKEGDKS